MMKARIRVAAMLLITAAAGAVFAEDEAPPKEASPDRVLKPFLWEIPGETPNYLLGTMHTVDKRVTDMHPVARKAFEDSEAVFLEVDLIKAQPVQLAAMRLPEGEKTSDYVPPELMKQLDARLAKISPTLTRAGLGLGELKPFAWVVLVPTLHEQFKMPGTPVLDTKLYLEGKRAGKHVGGLEDPKEQTAFVDALTHAEGVLMLRLLLEEWEKADKEGEDPSAEMVDIYLRGDGPALVKYAMDQLAGEKVPKDLADRLIKGIAYDRNERIAKAIAQILKEHPKRKNFFAVGAMHLLGEKCVQEYLKAHGVETRRVSVEKPTTPGPEGDKPAGKKKEPAGTGAGK